MEIIGDKPMVQHTVDTCRGVTKNTCVIIPENDPIRVYLRKHHIHFIEGSRDDVLNRYFFASKSLGETSVVRVTGDCPLIPMSQIKDVMREFINNNLDFCTNLPTVDGWDVEVISYPLLNWMNEKAPEEYREHVTSYLYKGKWNWNTSVWEKCVQMGFKMGRLKSDIPTWYIPKLSVDTFNDLTSIRSIYGQLTKNQKAQG